MATHYANENPVIQRAFLFSLFCGLRWCDVSTITFRNIDYANKLLIFEQNKTKGHSSASGVIIPLNDDILSLVGDQHPQKNAIISSSLCPLTPLASKRSNDG